MLLIAIRKGGQPCSQDCPFYTEKGVVRGINGPLKTHCRMTMNPWMVDCDVYNPCQIDKLEVDESQWQKMQSTIGKRAIHQRKLYPEDHAEIHHIGENTRAKGKWNSLKSSNVND